MIVKGTNLSMIRGDSEMLTIQVVDEHNDTIELVEGDVAYFTAKKSTSEGEVVYQAIITEFEDGTAKVTINPEDTRGLSFRAYVYDVQITFANGAVKTIIPPSAFTILPEVTYD